MNYKNVITKRKRNKEKKKRNKDFKLLLTELVKQYGNK